MPCVLCLAACGGCKIPGAGEGQCFWAGAAGQLPHLAVGGRDRRKGCRLGVGARRQREAGVRGGAGRALDAQSALGFRNGHDDAGRLHVGGQPSLPRYLPTQEEELGDIRG